MIVPLICAAMGLLALLRGVTLPESFGRGAKDGLHTLLHIFPALLFLLPMIHLMRASGLLDALTALFAPMLGLFGIPSEVAPILFLRPFSGSGALAAAADLLTTYGADSLIGRTAAVMLGSTETTFYVLTVYFGGIDQADTKRSLPAALIADMVGFMTAAWTVRWC
ncbi:MAG: spore maturation protein [Oscillospiraceae bacterium]|nr:spore maturation protein [Oscillospiraceae bacterium]